MSLPKHPFDITLLSCLSCPNLATTFSRQNWQAVAGEEKFGSRCCLQYTAQCSTVCSCLPPQYCSSHFLKLYFCTTLLQPLIQLYSTMKQTDGHVPRVQCVQHYHVIKLNIQTTLVIPGLHSIICIITYLCPVCLFCMYYEINEVYNM